MMIKVNEFTKRIKRDLNHALKVFKHNEYTVYMIYVDIIKY